MKLLTTRAFQRDVKRVGRRHKDLDKLWAVVDRLRSGERLERHHRVHRLSGSWAPSWECHIEPDWLLIWQADSYELRLVRTGTHADIFG